MTIKIITIVFIITKLTRFSIAKMLYDCPIQQYCKSGIHVVCMYSPEIVFGGRCENPVRIEVTPDLRHHILANVNYLRGIVAMGKETGQYGENIPKAYGLMKLEWDKKLAFSAQVLANQCLGEKADECRATERFSNPGQIIGTIPFKYPTWEYLKSSDTESQQGLDEFKLIFAIDTFLRSLHASKEDLIKDIFTMYPKSDGFLNRNLRQYLKLLSSGATHIGCGVSAYTNGSEKVDSTEKIKNIVQIVCNLSGTTRKNLPVCNVVRPTPKEGYTERCGCPRAYQETSNCLCETKTENLWRGLPLRNNTKTGGKRHSRIKNQYAMSINEGSRKTNDQVMRHAISKSRNFIVFRSNPEGHPFLRG